MNLIFDTHAHYDDEAFDPDREELLACSVGTFLLDGHTARFLSWERKWGVWCCGAHAA